MTIQEGLIINALGEPIALVSWDDETDVPPRLNVPRRGERRVRAEDKRYLLTHPYALTEWTNSARWDFTAVYDTPPGPDEDAPLIRPGTWTLPTEERWVVHKRRDLAGIYFLVGKQMFWPDRIPLDTDAVRYVSVAPPTWRSRKPLWDANTDTWVMPDRKAVVAADGTVTSIAMALDDSHINVEPGGSVVDPAAYSGVDELEETRELEKGDTLIAGVVTKRRPRYPGYAPRIFKKALTDAGLGAAFLTFLAGKGYTEEDVDKLKTVGLATKLIREFVLDQGYTMKQARDALQNAADAIAQAEAQFEKDQNG